MGRSPIVPGQNLWAVQDLNLRPLACHRPIRRSARSGGQSPQGFRVLVSPPKCTENRARCCSHCCTPRDRVHIYRSRTRSPRPATTRTWPPCRSACMPTRQHPCISWPTAPLEPPGRTSSPCRATSCSRGSEPTCGGDVLDARTRSQTWQRTRDSRPSTALRVPVG
jgi:hypothetical protein